MTKRFIILLSFILSLYSAPFAKVTLSVMDLSASGVTEDEAKTLTYRLISELDIKQDDSWFTLVAAEKRDEVLKEWSIQQTGVCDQASCIAKFGKALGVQMMVGGNVGKIGKTYTITLMLVDVATVKVIRTATRDYRGGPVDDLIYEIPSLVWDIMKYSNVEMVFRETIRLKPEDAEAHVFLGAVHIEKGNYQDAEKEFNEAVRLKPDYALAHGGIGAALWWQGKTDEAIKKLREANRLDPDNAIVLRALASWLDKKGERKEARQYWERALKVAKQPGDVWYIKKRLAELD